MSDYIAPTKEILFVIQELANLDYISSFSGFEDATEDLVEAIIEEAGKFSAEAIADTNVTGDKIGSTVVDKQVIETKGFKEAYQQIAEGGWISLACEQEFGGQGLPATIACGVNETLMSANLGLSLVIILSQSAISALSAHGSESLKKVYLENLVSGRWTGTMNLTEPQAGSDLSTVKTIATPHEDYYLIRGTKIFITWGDHGMTDNIVHLVLARTPDAPNGTSGLSLFLVPKFLVNDDGSLGERNDVFPISVEHKLGIHGSPTCILGFGENEGAQGFLIGELGKGLNAMFTMMNHARLDVALQGVAVSERAYQHATSYAKQRVQAGKTIINHPDVRRMLMHMRSATEAGRALCYLAHSYNDRAHNDPNEAAAFSAQKRVDLLTPIAKGWCTEVANEITSLGIQVHGGMGFVEETGAAQFYRDARILAIYEGTTGIQALDLVGRKFLRDQGENMASLLAEMDSTISELVSVRPENDALRTELELGVSTLRETCQLILKNQEQVNFVESVAFDFLMLTGYVVCGWLMAVEALAAIKLLDLPSSDEEYLTAKLATGEFFIRNLLPKAQGHARAILAGPDAIMKLSEDQL